VEVVAVHRLARVAIELLAYEQALGESERKKTEKRREPMRTKERIPFCARQFISLLAEGQAVTKIPNGVGVGRVED